MRRCLLCVVTLLVVMSLTESFNTTPGRLGCYQDTRARVMKHWRNTHEKNNVQFCRNMCQDFRFAGVEAGQWCMCGDEVPPNSLPDGRCNAACPGDPGQTCGGRWTLEVFPVEPKPVMQGTPLGCFKDAPNRVWKTGLIKLQGNSPQRCFDSCRGFRYAGLEAGAWCVCGDYLPPVTLPATKCQTQCVGYPGKTCGGSWALEVFELREAANKSSVLPGSDGVQVVGYVPRVYQERGDLGIYKLFTERKTWDEAWQQCEDDEAHLLIINSEEEAVYVRSLFAKVPSESRMHAGFHDLLRKGTYRTLFGQPLVYTVWSANYALGPSAIQHCGSVDKEGQLEQVDGNCGASAVFVCEKKSHSPDADGVWIAANPRGSLPGSGLG